MWFSREQRCTLVDIAHLKVGVKDIAPFIDSSPDPVALEKQFLVFMVKHGAHLNTMVQGAEGYYEAATASASACGASLEVLYSDGVC